MPEDEPENIKHANLLRLDHEALRERYGLSYHVDYALRAERSVGLTGKRVLEVGGSLPREFVADVLGAEQWICIENMSYWTELAATGISQGVPPVEKSVGMEAIVDAGELGEYAVLQGRVDRLCPVLAGQFDVIFSIAAFEHMDRFGAALDGMYAALRPGGRLFSMFSPIWSSRDGHHLPVLRSASGQEFDFARAPFPPWGHLLMRPAEMYRYLLDLTDRETASEIVYYVYHSPHINRLFSEDFFAYFEASQFLVEQADMTYKRPPDPELQSRLEALHPGYKEFSNIGIRVVLAKPGEVD